MTQPMTAKRLAELRHRVGEAQTWYEWQPIALAHAIAELLSEVSRLAAENERLRAGNEISTKQWGERAETWVQITEEKDAQLASAAATIERLRKLLSKIQEAALEAIAVNGILTPAEAVVRIEKAAARELNCAACHQVGDIIYCRCGNPSSHYGTMGIRGAREVREEPSPAAARGLEGQSDG